MSSRRTWGPGSSTSPRGLPSPDRYRAFGLAFGSEFPLPLPRTTARPDVRIRRARLDEIRRLAGQAGSWNRLGPDRADLYWRAIGAFRVEGGRQILVDCPGQEDALPLLLGVLLGCVLHQRGHLLLHGSSLRLPSGTVVALVGASGAGKSTLAAALQARGATVLSDDVTAVTSRHTVLPGLATLRLRPDAARALGYRDLPRVHPRVPKHVLEVSPPESEHPLHHVYVLDSEGPPGLSPLRGPQAVLELVRCTYAAALLRASGALGSHLEQCARLAAHVPVARLGRDDWDLAALAARVEGPDR